MWLPTYVPMNARGSGVRFTFPHVAPHCPSIPREFMSHRPILCPDATLCRLEALKAFGVSDVGFYYATIRHKLTRKCEIYSATFSLKT